jgi:hypothetical protein
MQIGRLLGNPLGLMDRVTNIPPLHTPASKSPMSEPTCWIS